MATAPTSTGRGDREDLRLVEADWPARPSQAARTGQGRLDLRLQLRGSQPASSARLIASQPQQDPQQQCALRPVECSTGNSKTPTSP